MIGIAVVSHIRLKPTNARRRGSSMHDTQTVAVLVICALEFESQLALGLGNSDSSSTLAQEVMRTHVCARNFGRLYRFKEIEVVGFPNHDVSRLHVRSCLVHKLLSFVPYIFDNLNCVHCASLIGSVLCNNIPHIVLLIIRCACTFRRQQSATATDDNR